MSKIIPVRKNKCATCPFRKGSEYAYLAPYLTARSAHEGRICHSTSTSAIKKTRKPPRICRGSRDFQLQMFHRMGFLKEPTDQAWAEKLKELKGGQRGKIQA